MATTLVEELLLSVNSQLTGIQPDVDQAWLAAQNWDLKPMFRTAFANGLISTPRPGEKTIKWRLGPNTSPVLNLDVAISDTSGTEFDLSPIARVTPDMAIQIDDEIIRVISVDTTAGTCQATRGYASTTAATHSQDVDGYILGQIPSEGADPGEGRAAFGATVTNYGHRLEKVAKLSDEALAQPKLWAGKEGTLEYELPRLYKEMGDELAYACWRSEATAADAEVRMMNGFKKQMSTNLYASVGALLFSDLDTAIEAILENSGIYPNRIFVNTTLGKALGVWGGARIATTAYQGTVGGALREYYSQIPGVPPLTIELDATLGAQELVVGNADELHAGWLSVFSNQFANQYPNAPATVPLRLEPFRTGPRVTVQMLGMATCQIGNEASFALLSGVSSVDSDGVE